ncbi:MAG: phospholipase A [Lautropia sp.]|nr:phospholipase A [Lautropia sp.]
MTDLSAVRFGVRVLPLPWVLATFVWPVGAAAQSLPASSRPATGAVVAQLDSTQVLLSPAQVKAIEKAGRAVSACIAIEQDAARLRCYEQVPPLSTSLRQGRGNAQGRRPMAAQTESGQAVPIPAAQAEDLMRAVARAQACRGMKGDADRLACYDEVAASRIAPPDRNAPEAAAHHYGLKLKTPSDPEQGQALAPAGEQTPRSWLDSGSAWLSSALPSFEPSPPDESRFLVDGRQASRAVQDVRRSLGADLTDRWELDDAASRGRFVLRPYKPMYAIVTDWSSRVNREPGTPNPENTWATASLGDRQGSSLLKNIEAKFQISLKTKIVENLIGDNGDIWVGYTQVSHWQIYTAAMSRPFRETNYEPEVMAVFRTHRKLGSWHWRMASIGLNHQSNGRSLPLSRSWNRLIFQFGLERDGWMMMLRPWWRVPETAKDDDNPDISDYLGRGEMLLVHRKGGHEMSLTARHSLRLGSRARGSLALDYAFPISSYLKAHLQVFRGYGASMIDYNHKQTRVGLGVSLVQWL